MSFAAVCMTDHRPEGVGPASYIVQGCDTADQALEESAYWIKRGHAVKIIETPDSVSVSPKFEKKERKRDREAIIAFAEEVAAYWETLEPGTSSFWSYAAAIRKFAYGEMPIPPGYERHVRTSSRACTEGASHE